MEGGPCRETGCPGSMLHLQMIATRAKRPKLGDNKRLNISSGVVTGREAQTREM